MTKKKILLIDDEADIRDVLKLALEDFGYEVFTAQNAEEGLEIFKEQNPPVVFTDIKMPGMDGITLLNRIKSQSPDTEVVMITGHGDMNLAIKSFQEEAADFITKPINVDVLEKTLGQVHEKIILRQKTRQYTENLESLLFEKIDALKKNTAASTFEPVMDRIPSYVMLLDRSFRMTAMNQRLRQDFGDKVGQCCHMVFKGSESACPDCPAERCFATGKSFQSENSLCLPAGRDVKVLAWATPVENPEGENQSVMVMAMKLGEIQEIHDRLASLGLMIGSMSHGIKGLLTGLDGGLYLVSSGVEKSDEGRIAQGAEMVRQMGGRIKRLIFDILFYAKKREMNAEQVSPVDLAGDTANVVRPAMTENRIDFECVFDPACPPVQVDPGFFPAALINVLENAADACQPQKDEGTGKVKFTVAPKDHSVLFSVADNGKGMDENTKEKMFNLFFSTKGQNGTGLGLFITHKIVTQHHGKIRVTSAVGKGTTVDILIPSAEDFQQQELDRFVPAE